MLKVDRLSDSRRAVRNDYERCCIYEGSDSVGPWPDLPLAVSNVEPASDAS